MQEGHQLPGVGLLVLLLVIVMAMLLKNWKPSKRLETLLLAAACATLFAIGRVLHP